MTHQHTKFYEERLSGLEDHVRTNDIFPEDSNSHHPLMYSDDFGSHRVKFDSYCFIGFWDTSMAGDGQTCTHTQTDGQTGRQTYRLPGLIYVHLFKVINKTMMEWMKDRYLIFNAQSTTENDSNTDLVTYSHLNVFRRLRVKMIFHAISSTSRDVITSLRKVPLTGGRGRDSFSTPPSQHLCRLLCAWPPFVCTARHTRKYACMLKIPYPSVTKE